MAINYTLLFYYILNSRESLSEIGKKIKKSQQYVNYNIKQLENQGIIEGYNTIFDYARFGYLVFHVSMKVIYSNDLQYEAMLKDFVNNPNVLAITEVGGVDLLIEFAARNPSSFNKSFKEVITKYRNQVQTYKVFIEIVKHNYPPTFLHPKVNQDDISAYKDIVLGADREPYDIHDMMKEICLYLLKNPKAKIVDIAREMDVSPKTVILKIRELENMKIIRGYVPKINYSKAGILHNKLFLQLRYQDRKQEKNLISFLKEYDHVTAITKTIGRWDLILDVHAFSHERIRKVFLTIREKTKDILKDVDVKPVDHVHKRAYLPETF